MARKVFAFLLLAIVAAVHGFAPASLSGGSSFAVRQNKVSAASVVSSSATRGTPLMMGGKKAKFGIFSPAVYAAKVVLGEKDLNSLRGKGISLHSQAIGDFCSWAGAYHLRTKLIKLAKTNGDTLGFLV